MTRGLPSAMATATVAQVVRPVIMAKLDFPSGVVRACTLDRSITTPVSGETYVGVGNFGGVDRVEEDIQLGANGITLLLSGIDTNLISTALGQNIQGRSATILMGLCDESWQLVAEPTVVFQGSMDTMSITSGDQAQVSLSCENRLAAWDRAKSLRYNDQTQKLFFPADKGLEFVEQAADRDIFWGRAPGVEVKS